MITRTRGAALLITGLVIGYLTAGNRAYAQATMSSDFPFVAGDAVDLQFELQDAGRN